MADIPAALAATRSAVNDLAAAGDKAAATWTIPRAPGKWSPSQVVEHVARALEESANMVQGAPSRLPSLPGFVRPVVRALLFNRVIRKGTFPKAKTTKAMDPERGPDSPAQGRARLEAALAKFDAACRARAESSRTTESAAFGTVALADYIKFQEVHTRHHTKQIPVA